MQETIVRFHSGLPLVITVVECADRVEIELTKSIALKECDGGRCFIGIETARLVAKHCMSVNRGAIRNRVLVCSDAHRFSICGRLSLAGRLLYQLIRDVIAREFAAHAERDFVVGCLRSLVVDEEVTERAAIGVILRNHRVKVMIGAAPAAGCAD